MVRTWLLKVHVPIFIEGPASACLSDRRSRKPLKTTFQINQIETKVLGGGGVAERRTFGEMFVEAIPKPNDGMLQHK